MKANWFVVHATSDMNQNKSVSTFRYPNNRLSLFSLSLDTWNCPCLGAVSVMPADTRCFSCDPVIPVLTPSVVYSEMSSVFTFTSCLFSALLYVMYILYRVTMPQRSAARGHWQGSPVRSLLAVRKLTLIGLVTICSPKLVPPRQLPRRASLNKSLFPGRHTAELGKRDKRKYPPQRELSKWEVLN